MNLDRFFTNFVTTQPILGEKPRMNDHLSSSGVAALPIAVYNDGLYVAIALDEALVLNSLIETVFPLAKGKVAAFAVDWTGRIFAIVSDSPDTPECAAVACFDLAEPSSFTTDANFEDFHNVVAVDQKADLFNLQQFEQWTSRRSPPNDGTSCVGYRIPLFLGGLDVLENMEMTERAVYLHTLSELYQALPIE